MTQSDGRSKDSGHSTVAEIAGIAVRVYRSLDEFTQQVLPPGGTLTLGFAVAINPEKIMSARRDPATRSALESATIRYADGAGVVWAMRRRGVHAPRITGCDLWERLMVRAAECDVPVALLGAAPEVHAAVVERLRRELPQLRLVANLHGYGTATDLASFRARLREAGPCIVAVAMGSPLQEKVIKSLRDECPNAFYMGVGGTFDVYAGTVRRAPQSWQRLDLEWLYRLICQPQRIKRQWRLIPYAALVLAGRV